MEITTLAIWIGLALLCMYMAEKRGRDKTLGFIAGLFFGLFAVIYYLIAGDSQQVKDEKLAEQMKRVDAIRGKK
jgi:hypothetical protein